MIHFNQVALEEDEMGEVVTLGAHRRKTRRISDRQWQLAIRACQELYYSPELSVRRDSNGETQRKILKLLARHFGVKDAPHVLEMILLSYDIHFKARIWEFCLCASQDETNQMKKLINRLLAVAHMRGKITTVFAQYLELKKTADSYDEKWIRD